MTLSRGSAGPLRLHDGSHDTFSLDEKYLRETGTIYLTGIQALVRLLLDQVRIDRSRGVRTAGIVSGYPGSPVAGLDMELERRKQLLREWDIVHIPGLNEDLAATAVFGSQLAQEVPGARFDGVVGMWFGKAPGVDRSGDAFRHGNFKGIGRNGGIIAVAGDDPRPNSSMLPSDSSVAFFDFLMPIIAPSDAQDVLDLGLHAYQLSRTSGLAVGFKVVTAVADMSQTIEVSPERVVPQISHVQFNGEKFEPRLHVNEGGARFLDEERYIHGARLEAALSYARANNLNRVHGASSGRSVGIISSGKTYLDTLQAMRRLGLDPDEPQRHGIRLLKLGMVWPTDVEGMRRFAEGLDEIIVVEEKRPFVELFLRDALYALADRPVVVGKSDGDGLPLLPINGELTPELIAQALALRLAERPGFEDLPQRAAQFARKVPARIELIPSRTAYFCSGCPHNRSLAVPDGSVVGAGIGCSIMETFMGREAFGDIIGYTHMGAEGAQWVGAAPFTDTSHMFQNVGDGTFSHSATLAVRFAIASGVTMTYKILHNSAVAMTGGQPVTGGFSVAGMVRLLEAEGVKTIVVTTEDLGRYKGIDLGPNTKVRHRDDLLEVEEGLAALPGVTVLINDQQCAAETRRLRKRGKVATPTQAVWINERVCEGCGDCGDKSNCLSVQPTDTEFGRKTKIHQSSCNLDYSCLLGDCPSFMTVEREIPKKASRTARVAPPQLDIDDPVPAVPVDDFSILMSGIGGTGVVTVNQILGTAAVLDGRSVRTMDSMGGSQKAGPVVSHLRVAAQDLERPAEIAAGEADALLIFDLLVGTDVKNMARAAPDRTVAVVSTTKVPTGRMVTDPSVEFPATEGLMKLVERGTRPDGRFVFDAERIAERLLQTHMAANMVVVGAAFQVGAIPLPEKCILEAIRLNGTAVELNVDAFRWGRLAIAQPSALAEAMRDKTAGTSVAAVDISSPDPLIEWADGELMRLLARRVPDLELYQNHKYALSYVAFVRRVAEAEAGLGLGSTALAESVAVALYKLMAYKDEYEVARLCLDDAEKAKLESEFGATARVYWHLHPPILRSLGMQRKLKLGPWFVPAFRSLKAMRRVRGTALDPFGYARIRRTERALVTQYRRAVETALSRLSPSTIEAATRMAQLPDLVRGYEHIKIANVEKYEGVLADVAREIGIVVPTLAELMKR
ncbi:MAG: indolepyruvate ferredoxin oxidoreductase [Acidimicrobiaceae bacterium]